GQCGQWKEAGSCDRRQERPEREEETALRLTPHRCQEAERDHGVEDCCTEGKVPERQDGHRKREGEAESSVDNRATRGERCETERPPRREERECPRSPARDSRGEPWGDEPWHDSRHCDRLATATTRASALLPHEA